MGSKTMRDIEGYESLYCIDEFGKIWSKRANAYLRPCTDNYGYKYVVLCNNGDRKFVRVHRLVASHFIPNPENKREVNHIDGNKGNNTIMNLEWCTTKENRKHAIETGLWNDGTKRKLSEINKGRIVTEEVRRKISITLKQRFNGRK